MTKEKTFESLMERCLMFDLETTLSKEKISVFAGGTIKHKDVKPIGTVSLNDIFEVITTGDGGIKEQCEKVREATTKEKRSEEKKKLPYWTFSGNFIYRRKKEIESITGYGCFDFDKYSSIEAVKADMERLKRDRYFAPLLAFVSPSGLGFKLVIDLSTVMTQVAQWPNDPKELGIDEIYSIAYNIVLRYFAMTYGEGLSEKEKEDRFDTTSDISRASYASYDPEAYISSLVTGGEMDEYSYERAVFDIAPWMEVQKDKKRGELQISGAGGQEVDESLLRDVEACIDCLEKDVPYFADAWKDWAIGIGLPFVTSLGERGRKLFHRVSRLSRNKYDEIICDKQYDSLLASCDGTKTIGSFFYDVMAITGKSLEEIRRGSMMKKIYPMLPKTLKMFVDLEEDDDIMFMLLMGALSGFGTLMNNVNMRYNRKDKYLNFYYLVVGSPSSGKGQLQKVKELFSLVDDNRTVLWKEKMAKYEERKRNNPETKELPPVMLSFFLSANNTAPNMVKRMNDNDERAFMFATESDGLFGRMDDKYVSPKELLLEAMENEEHRHERGMDNTNVVLKKPCLGICMSTTTAGHSFKYLLKDFKYADSGLLSRFWIWELKKDFHFNSIHEEDEEIDVAEGIIKRLQQGVVNLDNALMNRKEELRVKVTREQNDRFNVFFRTFENDMKRKGYWAVLCRTALNTRRIMSILAIIRHWEKYFKDNELNITNVATLEVTEEDYETAMCITEMMMDSMIPLVDDMLDKISKKGVVDNDLYDILPTDVEIRANEIIAKGKEMLAMSERTAKRRIQDYVNSKQLKPITRGVYMKPSA